ncbi:Succinyl-diaminopimelate desuccinylase [Buchnera aphidicola (Thelaxes suberi)]|uniref:succinyl-diaminopimelate desuccinylase n=1 Tax=Buchnera aphidicola TaxID=9 RepID=UPI0034648F07
MNCPIVKLTQKLIRIPSISPLDYGCQDILIKRLLRLGFIVEKININNTSNFWAYKGSGKSIVFLGHTDVVPSGNLDLWKYDPFQGYIENGILYGRGAVDMKGALAAMILAVEEFILSNKNNYKGRLGFLITSDEEDKGTDGIAQVVKILQSKGVKIDYCIVGEPTSSNYVGDYIKNGRRGSLNVELKIQGIQGHIAYPHLSNNPIHTSLPFLIKLIQKKWDAGNQFFPPTMLQISSIQVDNNKNNMIPSYICINFNIRFGPINTVLNIKKEIYKLLKRYNLNYTVKWNVAGNCFYTKPGKLLTSVKNAISKIQLKKTSLSTSGGTSDGRFLPELGAQVIELGLINKTIHQVNECVKISDLQVLTRIYQNILEEIMV